VEARSGRTLVRGGGPSAEYLGGMKIKIMAKRVAARAQENGETLGEGCARDVIMEV